MKEKKINIFLLINNFDHRVILRKSIMKSAGKYSVKESESYDGGLKKISKSKYDIIFLDYPLPMVGELDILSEIRKRFDLPVIVVSKEGDSRVSLEVLKRGAIDHGLISRLDFQEVDRLIQVTLERQRLLRRHQYSQDELKSSEERLRILFENTPDGIFLHNLKAKLLDGNKAAEEIVGYKREEMIGKSFLKLDLLSLNQIPKAVKALAKNALGKATGPEEYTISAGDKKKRIVEIKTFPVKIKGETIVLGIARDITKRKNQEMKKEKDIKKKEIIFDLNNRLCDIPMGNLENKLDLIIDKLVETIKTKRASIMLPDKTDGKLKFVASRGLWEKTQKIVDAAEGNERCPVAAYVCTTGKEVLINSELDLEHYKKKNVDFSFFVPSRKGSKVFYSMPFLISPIIDNRKLVGVLNLSEKSQFSEWDKELIHETKNLIARELKDELHHKKIRDIESDSLEREKKLIKAEQLASLGELTSAIGHEIYQPLNSIKMLAQSPIYWKKMQKELSYKELMENFSDVLSRVDIINDIIENMKLMVKNPNEINIKKLNINNEIEKMLHSYQDKLKSKKIKLVSVLNPQMTDILFSETQFHQVIINLMENAINAFEMIDTSNKKIIIKTEDNDDFVNFSIEDNGPGVGVDNIDDIFKPFFSVHQNKKGMGMGLYIVQSILKSYNAEIEAKNNRDKGAAFNIKFSKKGY